MLKKLVFLLLLCAPQFFCAAPVGAENLKTTFTFRLPGEPETLDWNRAHTPVETYLLVNLMEGLLQLDENLKITPTLAESFKISEDGRTYTFKLRNGIKWSDGVGLKAQDFVFSWKRLLSPLTGSPYAYFLFDVEGAEWFYKGLLKDFSAVGIKALDDQTLQVKLARSIAHWIYIPTFWVTFPLRQDIVEKHGTSWDKPGRMVTVGPFVPTVYELGSKIVLHSNPHYYDKRGTIQEVVALILKDDAQSLKLYEAGKIDFLTDFSVANLKRLEGRKDLKTFPYLKTAYLGFSIKKFPATNRHLRRAIAFALDKKKIAGILHGDQEPATSFIPPRVLGHSKEIGLPFDSASARKELQATGLTENRKIRLDLLTPNWDKATLLAEWIRSELKQVLGLEISVQAFDNKLFLSQLQLHTHAAFTGNWSADYPDPDNFMSLFLNSSGNNRTHWKDTARFDDRVLEARSVSALKSREKIYHEVQRLLLEKEAVVIPLYYEPIRALIRPSVKGIKINPLNYLYLKNVSKD